jgi:hypothetical protein
VSYNSLIDSQLKRAFNLLKDLAVDATFQKKNVTGFDFNTSTATLAVAPDVVTKIVITGELKKTKESKVITKTIMCKSKDMGSLNSYSTVVIDGVVWRLGDPIKDSGYILVTTMIKEV